jgi:ribosomal protein L7/L12
VFLPAKAAEVGSIPALHERGRQTHSVALIGCPVGARVRVMAAIRALLPISMVEAKRAVDAPPAALGEKLTSDVAFKLRDELTAAGAAVSCEPDERAQRELSFPEEWVQARSVELAGEGELLDFLEGTFLSLEEEKTVRVAAWRDGNHRFRTEGSAWIPLPKRPAASANLERLLGLLGGSPDDQILRAEVLRELGRFSQALAVLALIDSPCARTLAALAERGVAQVSIVAVAA